MDLAIDELGRIISDYVQVGFCEAVKAYEPTQDEIRKSEVKRWLKFNKVSLKTFDALESIGMVKARRGSKVNSPLYYSKAEILNALATMKIKNMYINDKLKEYGREEHKN